MNDDPTLLTDQVFQLNTLLWSLEEAPKEGSIDPVLHRAGYRLRAIGQKLIMPLEESALKALGKLTRSPDRSPTRPDLWLRHSSDIVDPIIEIKAHGFSVTSSNSYQAVKMIASAADVSASLGESAKRPGHVVYATVSSDSEALSETLSQISEQLTSEGVETARTAVLGLSVESGGIALSSPKPEDLPEPAKAVLTSPVIVLERDGDNDLQPLYFVPWMPGLEGSQDPNLQSEGLKELTARVLIHTLAKIGQAKVPDKVELRGEQLLSDATFGIFDRWRDSDQRQFVKAVTNIVKQALGTVVEITGQENDLIEVYLPDSDARDSAIRRLERADPADPKSNLENTIKEPPRLFDV